MTNDKRTSEPVKLLKNELLRVVVEERDLYNKAFTAFYKSI